MNKQQANNILNQVREGNLYPHYIIVKALTITGDIDGKCIRPYHSADNRRTDSDSPSVHHAGLQSLEG